MQIKRSNSHNPLMFSKNCEVCNKSFFVHKSTYDRRKTCSRECNYKWQKGKVWSSKIPPRKLWNCQYCGKEELKTPSEFSKRRFCSHQCASSATATGPKHYNWKGGVTSQKEKERDRFAKSMNKIILKRDNYTCQLCGSRDFLQIDHIQPWAEYVELRFNIENCRTLCMSCHYQITFGKPMPPTVRARGYSFKGGAKK